MELPLTSSGGNAPKLIGTTVVEFYDSESGRAHHIHTAEVHEGAEELSEAAVIDRAKQHARRLGHDLDALKVKVSSGPA